MIETSNLTVFDMNNFDNLECSVQFCQRSNLLPPFCSGCPACLVGKLKYEVLDAALMTVRLSCTNTTSCAYSVGLIHGTWFQQSKLPLGQSLQLIYLWCMGVSVRDAAFHTKVSYGAASESYRQCRKVCSLVVSSGIEQVGGKGKLVEVAESRLLLQKGCCDAEGTNGARNGEFWLLVGREKGSKKCFLLQVPDSGPQTLQPLLQQYIRRGSAIVTDCWRPYHMLLQEGYGPWSASVGVELVRPHHPHVHGPSCLLHGVQSSLPDEGGATISGVQPYLEQFLYRRLYPRSDPGELFSQFVRHVAMFYPGPLKACLPEEDFQLPEVPTTQT